MKSSEKDKYTLTPAPVKGWFYLVGPKRETVRKTLSGVPGVKWESNNRRWVIPLNIIPRVAPFAELTLETPQKRHHRYGHDYQKEKADFCLHHGRALLDMEQRTGKTIVGSLVLERQFLDEKANGPKMNLPARRTLIVTPATARDVWEEWIVKNWKDYPGIYTVKPGFKRFSDPWPPAITVCSYEMLRDVSNGHSWTDLIVDECHYLKTNEAKRTDAVRSLTAKQWKNGLRLFLSGTALDNDIDDLWSQMDLLYPGSVGNLYQWRKRYMLERDNEWATSGKEYYGLNEEHAAELRDRIAAVSGGRITKKMVAHLFQKPVSEIIKVESKKKLSFKQLLKNFKANNDSGVGVGIEDKFGVLRTKINEVRKEYNGPIIVLTYFIGTAEKIAKLLGTPYIVTSKTGDMPKRRKVIEKATSENGIVVASMRSLLVGIDLPQFSEVFYAELSWRPSDMSQSAARYDSMNSKRFPRYWFLAFKGSPEESVAETLAERLDSIDKVVGSGVSESTIMAALAPKVSDETALEELGALCG